MLVDKEALWNWCGRTMRFPETQRRRLFELARVLSDAAA